VKENKPVGTVVGAFQATDNNGDHLRFRLLSNLQSEGEQPFVLDTNGTLRTATVFDFETDDQNYTIRVRAIDEYNASIQKPFLVTIVNVVEDNDGDGEEDHYDPDDDNDGFSDEEELAYGSDPRDASSVVNQPPSDLLMDGGEVAENQEIGKLVARFIGVDADEEDTLRYKLIGQENNSSLPFRLSPAGNLKTTRVLDYETDDHNYSITVRVTDDLNTSFQKEFIIHLTNVVEDMDGDGIEDTYDEDRDGDGFSNEKEVAEGTDPDDVYSLINLPILKTSGGYLDTNGSIVLSGQLLADGEGSIEDFGFVLSSRIQLSSPTEYDFWIRAGEGAPELFRLRVQDIPFEHVFYFRAWARNAAGYGLGPVKKVILKSEPGIWWGNALELKGGWMQSPWLGTFRPYDKGWLYHARLGWLYFKEAPEESVWLWHQDNGWLWTKEGVWPYLWSNNSSGWIYIYPGELGKPVFLYDQSTGLNHKL